VKRSAVLFLSCAFLIVFTAPVFADAAASATSTQPLAAPLNDFAGQIMASGKTGRVGIGTTEPAVTLDVYHGEVKIGSTGAPCIKEIAGTIRFGDDRLWVCNSHGWSPLTTGVPQK
jgi:hypothetical protein